jgi:hypothetical protein
LLRDKNDVTECTISRKWRACSTCTATNESIGDVALFCFFLFLKGF